MSMFVKAGFAGLLGLGALVGAASSADASYRHGCSSCGSRPTQYVYHDEYRHSVVYHHSSRYHRYPVDVPQLTVHVTRIHPVVAVHNLVTVHEQPYPVIVHYSKYERVTEPAAYTYSTSTAVVHEPCYPKY